MNSKNEDDLLRAAECGDVDELNRLLALGVDVNTRYDNILGENTALITAIDNQNDEFAKALLAAGADINLQGYDGNTALMVACYNAYFDEVKLLLHAGADTNLKNDYGQTALDLAEDAFEDSDDIIDLLS
jgi:ankyrin repeat protein